MSNPIPVPTPIVQPTNSQDIQNLIDAKVQLIGQIVSQLASLLANPRPDYDIDGQTVKWAEYQKYLTDMQMTEVKSLKSLYELQNIIAPYQFQASAAGGVGPWGGGWCY